MPRVALRDNDRFPGRRSRSPKIAGVQRSVNSANASTGLRKDIEPDSRRASWVLPAPAGGPLISRLLGMVGAICLTKPPSVRRYFHGKQHHGGDFYLALIRKGYFISNYRHPFPQRSYRTGAATPADYAILPDWSTVLEHGHLHADTTNEFHDAVQGRTVNAGISVRLAPGLCRWLRTNYHRQVTRHGSIASVNLIPNQIGKVAESKVSFVVTLWFVKLLPAEQARWSHSEFPCPARRQGPQTSFREEKNPSRKIWLCLQWSRTANFEDAGGLKR